MASNEWIAQAQVATTTSVSLVYPPYTDSSNVLTRMDLQPFQIWILECKQKRRKSIEVFVAAFSTDCSSPPFSAVLLCRKRPGDKVPACQTGATLFLSSVREVAIFLKSQLTLLAFFWNACYWLHWFLDYWHRKFHRLEICSNRDLMIRQRRIHGNLAEK